MSLDKLRDNGRLGECLTQRLNTEKEFQFVTKPTKEGEQDAEDDGSGDDSGTPPFGGD